MVLFILVFTLWYVLIFIIELMPLIKKKKYSMLVVNMILLGIAAALQFCLVLELKFPSMTALLLRGFDYLFLPG